MLKTFQAILFFSICILMSSCFEKEYEVVAIKAAEDDKVTKEEFLSVANKIKATENAEEAQVFKMEDGNIDYQKLYNFLLKFYSIRNIIISDKNIWNPNNTITKPFNINVFIENSKSMDGYVNGRTEFETAIYNLLGDIKIGRFCNQLNLSYINKTIPYQKINALPSDLQDFIEKLEPSTFQLRGGDRKTSDMKNLLQTVLDKVDKNNASILISDFVFSPGSGVNAQDYLEAQSVGIKIDFAQKLRTFDLSAIIIQLESDFNGIYYDKNNTELNPQKIIKRPYYLWILGNRSQIQSILDSKILDNIRGNYLNRLIFSKNREESSPNFKVMISPRIGEFSPDQLDKKIICEAEVSDLPNSKGKFGFTLAVDYSKSMQDNKYFLDKNNYTLSNTNYKIKISPNNNPNNIPTKGFTHILNLETNKIEDESLKINLLGNTPSWVYESTSFDDSNIVSNIEEQKKTFGLKFLIEGVNDAFNPPNHSKIINTIQVTIKK